MPRDGEKSRDVVIKLLSSDADLRYRGWIEHNRRYVEKRTEGTSGLHLCAQHGYRRPERPVPAVLTVNATKQALIIDDRWNGGGQIPTRFIELLNRPVTNYWARRDGHDMTWPPDSHQGPKCMLINGLAGSGGDMFPALFRQAGLGKLIGMRTWGGLVGISGNPGLIDGRGGHRSYLRLLRKGRDLGHRRARRRSGYRSGRRPGRAGTRKGSPT